MFKMLKTAFFVVCVLTGFSRAASAREIEVIGSDLRVEIDKITVQRAPLGTRAVMIGNSIFADVRLGNNGELVIVGRGYGTTNIIFQNAKGEVIHESSVVVFSRVDTSLDTIIVNSGGSTRSYFCIEICQDTYSKNDAAVNAEATAKVGLPLK